MTYGKVIDTDGHILEPPAVEETKQAIASLPASERQLILGENVAWIYGLA